MAGGQGWGVRVKARHASATILGPRQLILSDGPKVAGMSKEARWNEEFQRYDVEARESFRGGASAGNVETVLTRSRSFRLRGVDHRRVHLPGGLTEARSA